MFGSLPPKRESFEDICGPPTVCPDCPDPRDFKCKDMSITLYDLLSHLEIKPTDNYNYPGLPNRTFGEITYINQRKFGLRNGHIFETKILLDCVLYAVGKPVYHKFTEQNYGSWLKDAQPKNDDVGEKIWYTNETDVNFLYEFENKIKYRNSVSKKYALPFAFTVSVTLIFIHKHAPGANTT